MTAPHPYPERRVLQDLQPSANIVKVSPGEHYVTAARDKMIMTVLGSCVAACIRDPVVHVGGLNHFMLPASENGSWGGVNKSLRYGNFAMERLINDILVRGGERRRLEIKVFGGANVLKIETAIGRHNAEFVEDYLAAEGLPIAASHLYGQNPRRIHYYPFTGEVQMLELRRQSDLDVVDIEGHYGEALRRDPVCGSIELFDKS